MHDVVEALLDVEQLLYKEVDGSRKLARVGVDIPARVRELKKLGKQRVEAAVAAAASAKVPTPKLAPWITFHEFLSVMDAALFSMKAHPPTAAMAAELLEGSSLFTSHEGSSGSIPNIAVSGFKKLNEKKLDSSKHFLRWAKKKTKQAREINVK